MHRRRRLRSAIFWLVAVTLLAMAGLMTGSRRPLTPTTATAGNSSWMQDAHDAQRTGTTSDEATEPWTYFWSFNGSDMTGGSTGHFADAPINAHSITGGGNVFVPLGSSGLYAIGEASGAISWHAMESGVSFNATPAYDPATGYILVGGSDGSLYEYDGQNGTLIGSFRSSGPLDTATMIVGGYVYFVTDGGSLYKLSIRGLSSPWTKPYSAGGSAGTMPAFSPSRQLIIYCTDDLYCQAVNDADGSQKWRVKPWAGTPAPSYNYDHGWPVIAEQHGIVLVRQKLSDSDLYNFQNGAAFPTSNAAVRSLLLNNPTQQNVFALSLDTGAPIFIPALGDQGAENDWAGTRDQDLGTIPVIKTWPNGDEVAYTTFRQGTCSTGDFRWDGHMGELMLDSSTAPGYSPGDLRYVNMDSKCYTINKSFTFINDESAPLTMAGSTLFYAHFAASEAYQVTNRQTSLGTESKPITGSFDQLVARLQDINVDWHGAPCADYKPASHYTTCNIASVTGRFYAGPAFWALWNAYPPPANAPGLPDSYGIGRRPVYTYAADGYVIVEGVGGDLTVFGTANSPLPAPAMQYRQSISPVLK